MKRNSIIYCEKNSECAHLTNSNLVSILHLIENIKYSAISLVPLFRRLPFRMSSQFEFKYAVK